jgi:ferritin-like metal-binding protein YciE
MRDRNPFSHAAAAGEHFEISEFSILLAAAVVL